MDTGCSDAESSSSHGVSWSNLTTPCCVQGSRQRHYSRSHDLQNENVLLLVIFQTYGVSSRHDGHSYVCSMGLWFFLRTVCCKRPKSLRDFLVQARLKPNSDDDNQTGECRPCGRKRCQCCKIITSAGTVKSSSGPL